MCDHEREELESLLRKISDNYDSFDVSGDELRGRCAGKPTPVTSIGTNSSPHFRRRAAPIGSPSIRATGTRPTTAPSSRTSISGAGRIECTP